eukprot:gnl/TRDRNA2_/TRDRNA2_155056_c0_seq1.p2 gnl/TRDRNA2_/TRDRNA2_155056_c0~~gnl/TRDRNA2_/TRDRNA2_155056_c0_seq1.p2  ORF type:complete len:135 (-),score=5.83 gnl/TRDRNA2_/TRDRNA2_155056_c0_seq1:340-744(-)
MFRHSRNRLQQRCVQAAFCRKCPRKVAQRLPSAFAWRSRAYVPLHCLFQRQKQEGVTWTHRGKGSHRVCEVLHAEAVHGALCCVGQCPNNPHIAVANRRKRSHHIAKTLPFEVLRALPSSMAQGHEQHGIRVSL